MEVQDNTVLKYRKTFYRKILYYLFHYTYLITLVSSYFADSDYSYSLESEKC